jgi:formylglycine-generating enzyme required for sulfatase activity
LDSNSSWIFHDALGWVYPVSSGGNENWLYQSTLGWMWTNQSVYPYLYLNSGSEWIYINQPNQAYYSYSSNSWINLGGGPSSPIEDYNASKTYAMGSLARVGQDSFMATQAVPAGTSPPNTTYWTDLSVVATALGVPVESVPTLSTSTILASIPGSNPNTGGPSAPTGATHVVDLNSSVQLQMIRVEPGTFIMGSPTSEAGRRDTDETEHNVTLTKPFYLGKYEVTQAQYEAVMTGNTNGLSATPSYVAGNPNRPVEVVSWDDVQIFLTRLNAAEQAAGRLPAGWSYVLPTEAQWEYACRAGTTTAYTWGNSISPNNANYNAFGQSRTVIVGEYSANAWGFHDMHGNVWEWCADWYGVYPTGSVADPSGPASGSNRVIRGGSWLNGGALLRSAERYTNSPGNRNPTLGFRVGFQQQ